MSVVAQHTSSDKVAIRPFSVDVPEADLADLRRRINATRFPEKETVADFSQGVPLDTVQKLARYWATEYDWRKVEARLKSVPNYITEVDGLDIHFIHVVIRSEPYCHCLTRSGTVKASQTFRVGAIILTVESDVFTCTSPRKSACVTPRQIAA